MKKLILFFRYDFGLWLIGLLTDWLPEISATCKLRGFLCHPFLKHCGKNFQYGRGVRFLNSGGIEIGNDVYIAAGCWLSGGAPLIVEDEVIFGPYCIIVTANHTFDKTSYRWGRFDRKPVKIKKGAWISAHVVITPGVTIGERALVAANAVVTKDTENDVIIGGVPAKAISKRIVN